MAPVGLPLSGAIYLDAQIFVYSVERHPTYFPLLRSLWEALDKASVVAHTSELTMLETLVLPRRNRDADLEADYNRLFESGKIQLHPVSRAVLNQAATLRAEHVSLRTPDAIHLATAQKHNCDYVVTNDAALTKASAVPVVLLSNLLAELETEELPD